MSWRFDAEAQLELLDSPRYHAEQRSELETNLSKLSTRREPGLGDIAWLQHTPRR